MTMVRKDFKAIADIIREYKLIEDNSSSVYFLTTRLCHYFKQANSTFDKGKFLKACGFYNQ